MPELFRREAVAYAQTRLEGEVFLTTPLSWKLLSAAACVAVGALCLFAATATYARKEVVPGWLIPAGGAIRVVAREGGIVESLSAHEGATVSAGQPLATLRLSRDLPGGDTGVALAESLAAEGEASDAAIAAELSTLAAEQSRLVARQSALRRELAEALRRVDVRDQRVSLARKEVERAEAVAESGFLPRREVDIRRAAALSAEDDLASARALALEVQREILDTERQLEAVPPRLAALRAKREVTRASFSQRRTETSALSSYVATAPVDGRLEVLPVHVGQAMAAGAVVAVMSSGDRGLVAELYVPSRAVGFIREGQEVRLMYQAYPHEKFGAGRAIVSSVSRTSLAPAEVTIPGLSVNEPVFRVRAKVAQDTLRAYGELIRLRPGLVLQAHLVIDRRSLLEWLLDPLYAARGS